MTYLKHAIQQLTDLVQQNMTKQQNKDGDEFQWDVNVEILFLHSLFGLKPVGKNIYVLHPLKLINLSITCLKSYTCHTPHIGLLHKRTSIAG